MCIVGAESMELRTSGLNLDCGHPVLPDACRLRVIFWQQLMRRSLSVALEIRDSIAPDHLSMARRIPHLATLVTRYVLVPSTLRSHHIA